MRHTVDDVLAGAQVDRVRPAGVFADARLGELDGVGISVLDGAGDHLAGARYIAAAGVEGGPVVSGGVDACAEAGPALLATSNTPLAALTRWVDLFVDFLATKHGLAAALQANHASYKALHAYFPDRLVPVGTQLLEAAADAGEIRADVHVYEPLRGIGNVCIGAHDDPRYDARRMVALLLAGLRRDAGTSSG